MPPYIVLHTTLPQTIPIGVYATKKEAYEEYLAFLEERFPNLLIKVEEYYEDNYPNENLIDLLMNPDTYEKVDNILSFSVLESLDVFEEDDYDNWDNKSLNRLREMIYNEDFGDTWY